MKILERVKRDKENGRTRGDRVRKKCKKRERKNVIVKEKKIEMTGAGTKARYRLKRECTLLIRRAGEQRLMQSNGEEEGKERKRKE